MESPRLSTHLDTEPLFRLPEWRTPIIGREKERADLSALLQQEDVWLVTVTGPGGVGKSRLVHAVARDLAGQFDGQVGWISLAAARDRNRAIEQMVSALGIAPGADSAQESLVRSLRHRRALLVLDNLEQVPDLAPSLAELADELPDLKILATSRVPLRLRGERDQVLGPLTAPGPAGSFAELCESPGVRLFVSRAEAADSNFSLTEENAADIAEICRRLDGLPLAIELAAARVRLLTPSALVPRLTRSLDLLTTGPRDAPERHQTLRNTIQWSYDLLPEETRRVFRQLSVFSDAFGLDAAQAVAGTSEDVLDHLATLIEHSLLLRLGQPHSGRFAMLETIREFAASVPASEEERRDTARRHASYFAALARTSEVRPAQHAPWLDLVEGEIGHIRDALDWFEAQDDWEELLTTVNMLGSWWLSRGNIREGYEWLRRVAPHAPGVAPSVRVDTQISAGWFATQVGDFDYAKSMIDGIDLAELNDEPIETQVRYCSLQGAWCFLQEDVDNARLHIDRARQLAEDRGIIAQTPSIRINLGAIAAVRGDLEEARKQHLLGLQESTGIDVRAIHAAGLANIETRLANLPAVWPYLRAGWNDARQIGYVQLMVSAMATKAELMARLGRMEDAATILGAADELRQSRGWSIVAYMSEEYNGLIDLVKQGMPDDAYTLAEARGRAMLPSEIDALMEFDPFVGTVEPAADDSGVESRRHGLTSRELEVLRQLVQGKTNPEIADELFISERTVQTHVARILQKLGVSSRSAAAVAAVREGIA
jgi:predicted ATPase/DNA-binding CsgD family transcriptional regulator